MAQGDGRSQVKGGQTKDISNGVVRRKRGRPRKHPLPDAAGTSKVAKNTGTRDNEKAAGPTTTKKQQAGGNGLGETLLHQSCTDELLESLLEESPTIPLGTRINGNQAPSYSLNEQQVYQTMDNGPRNRLQRMQRDAARGFTPDTNGEPSLRRGGETGRESQQCAGGQNEPQLAGKGAARPADVEYLSSLQENPKQSFYQGDVISQQTQNKNQTNRHPVASHSSKLALSVNHLKMTLLQSQLCIPDKNNDQDGCTGQAFGQMLCTNRQSLSSEQKYPKVDTEKYKRVQEQSSADPHLRDELVGIQDGHNQHARWNQQDFLNNCFSQEIASFQEEMDGDSGGRENSHRSNSSKKDGTDRQDGIKEDVRRQVELCDKWNGQEYCGGAPPQFQASGQEVPSRTSVSLGSLLGEENVKMLHAPSGLQAHSESCNSLMLLLKTAARLEIELQKTSRQLEVQREQCKQQQIHIDKLEALYTDVHEENERLREVFEYRRIVECNTTRRDVNRGVLPEGSTYLRRIPEQKPFSAGMPHDVPNHPGSASEARGRRLPPYPNEGYL
eukprot:CAMPEP_0183828724 /NCGR_PEP_ID=MMETSP0807_2-20130328/2942_1 /TAXON_ID=88271 /ORGANISM="Picocystis salinarum, Strain CCMP1897" /LENGTH=555 /DNA_ID=CAMNT_0026073925 /DNA_START=24 /DNA_END=1691 /DNA_ORIENTATION=-